MTPGRTGEAQGIFHNGSTVGGGVLFESADLSNKGMNKLISDGQVEENLHNQQESVSDIWGRIWCGTLITRSILTSVQSSNLLYKTVDGGVAFVAALLN